MRYAGSGIKEAGSGIRREGSGITVPGSGIASHGSRSALFVGIVDQSVPFFKDAFVIKDQKFGCKNEISDEKTYLVTILWLGIETFDTLLFLHQESR